MSEGKSLIPQLRSECSSCNCSGASNCDPLQSIVTDKLYDWIIISSNHNFHLDFEAKYDDK